MPDLKIPRYNQNIYFSRVLKYLLSKKHIFSYLFLVEAMLDLQIPCTKIGALHFAHVTKNIGLKLDILNYLRIIGYA